MSHVPDRFRIVVCMLVVLLSGVAVRAGLPPVKAVLDDPATRPGMLVQLGCGDGSRSVALSADGRFVVQALDRDAGRVAAARRGIATAGKYGPVSANVLEGATLPYRDNLINVLVVDDASGVSKDEMLRVLEPLGVLWTAGADGGWESTVKPWPKGMDEWTHFLHDASGNAVSEDDSIGPPRRLQWTGGEMWTRGHEVNNSMPAMVSARGRLFYVFDEGVTGMEDQRLPEKWTLVARDAFNGALLWERPMSTWGSEVWGNHALRFFNGDMARRLVASGDKLFVTFDYGKGVEVLDAATGKTLGTVPKTDGVKEILVDGDDLFAVSEFDPRRPDARVVFTRYDLKAEKLVWQAEDARYVPQMTSVSDDAVVYHNRKEVVCLNRADGKRRWTFDSKENINYNSGMMLVADGKLLIATGKGITAVSLADGKTVWTAPGTKGSSMRGGDMFVADGQVFANASSGNLIAGYDLKTGKPTTRIDPTNVQSEGHHLRCYRAKATEKFLITQYRGVEFVGLSSQEQSSQNDWLRGSCTYGVMPANGFLYQPPHGCFCYAAALQKGFNAYAGPPAGQPDHTPVADEPGAIEKGAAYGYVGEEASDTKGWPAYRHDERRTGGTTDGVTGELTRRWKVDLGTDVTPPVAADGRVYVVAKAHHTLHALDGATGKAVWTFTAGAQVDSPPTIWRGLLVFGCADGYAYCVRATDGQLAWRRRLAPQVRWMADHGQLESVWRVHGSAPVVDGLAYCIAGRSSFVDGGLFLTAIDVKTGEIKHRTNLYTGSNEREDIKRNTFMASYNIEGAQSDLLVAEGGFIFLDQFKFSPDLKLQPAKYLTKEEVTKRPSMNLDNKDYVNDDIFKVKWRNTTYSNYDKLAGILVDEKDSEGERDLGLHMFTTSGFLDTSFFNRTFWSYSATWMGFNMSILAPKSGQLVVVGPKKTYALKAYTSRYPLTPTYTPGTKGYLIIADDNHNEPTLDPRAWGKDKGMGFSRGAPPIWHHWIPVRVNAMVLGGDKLIVCGAPDEVKEGDPNAAFEGRLGSRLWELSAETGEIVGRHELKEMPAFDGMIVADGRLYMCTTGGAVIGMGGE
ncbi:MAG: PQQ-binding-like beta-propeller repeat protein [Phycisphaera sp.]|nr:PQQ-binding-like beta-propeller repeat protein [Phycisphaera sp.]